ncbi:MAG: S-adenosylmethionine synthase [Berkelbacteria bacterium GW2011_GWA2_46_7]|uniref:Methionine adenosyltransferase n=1 Tax=Berkelbacteria bacterium GW2011_GWA2_46_7 TaxID=1618335 RepID=A0A0G1SME3_9BACT|nr:MAG: S-adenosylmethionine synthase [Berkelbacteria bacterium GW2011_GWA2_46_7]
MTMGMRKARMMATEFVTDGHPDKVCDQVADSIVDAALQQDPSSRVAMEVQGGHGAITVTGEMTTSNNLDIGSIARNVYKDIGHDHDIAVFSNVVNQANDIDTGVSRGGAGDQGIMVGYAIDDGPNYMPWSWTLSRELCEKLKELRETGRLPYLRPDGKSLIVMEDDRVTHVTLAAHHAEGVEHGQIKEDLIELAVRPIVDDLAPEFIKVNGTGNFVQGGFDADAGTTGRKLMIDNYGPNVEVGGGCYSGKDPSKVDRSAAYYCRMIAKSIVAGGHAPEAIVKVGYTIGIAQPAYVSVVTSLEADAASKLEQHIRSLFTFEPRDMIEQLGLLTPNGWSYRETARAGHYGNDHFPWEKIVEI